MKPFVQCVLQAYRPLQQRGLLFDGRLPATASSPSVDVSRRRPHRMLLTALAPSTPPPSSHAAGHDPWGSS